RRDVPERGLLGGPEEHRDLHGGERGPRVHHRARHRARDQPGLQGSRPRAGRGPGTVGLPDGHLRGDVAPDVPGPDRRHQRGGQRHRPDQRADPLRHDAAAPRGDLRRRLEDDAFYGAAAPRGTADHPRRGLRGGARGRGERDAALLPHHDAAAQGHDPGRGPVPHARRLPGLRPVLGDERPAARVPEHVRVQEREGQPAPVRAGERGIGLHLRDGVLDRPDLYQGLRHADLGGGV
ncbi:Maltodextrin ABC transporter, permease protein MdxF, partial [uncultured Rubrobacteraceae bacterium]